MASLQPIPRAGRTDDIAKAAVFLASDDSTFINGHDLVVDGGVVGGRLWTPHQQGVQAMRQAFGVDEGLNWMIAVLFSEKSRAAYAAEAHAREETYTFTDAWGMPRTWLKGEYAYLAPNAARPAALALQSQARADRGSRAHRRRSWHAAGRC